MKWLLIAWLFAQTAIRAEVTEEKVLHAGAVFRVVILAPEKVKLVWKDSADVPYRSFDKVQAALTQKGKSVKFLMNAGIFEPGGIPSGLHVEERKTLHPVNLADAPGNFFLKPNGVLWIEGGNKIEAFISTPEKFLAREVMGFRWLETAMQSGPLLLIAGKRHPAFTENSKSKLHRNGVGVNASGQIVFAMTADGQVTNFWDFSGLFLKLGCKDALFLDGSISQMAVNPSGPVSSNLFGAMFVVAE